MPRKSNSTAKSKTPTIADVRANAKRKADLIARVKSGKSAAPGVKSGINRESVTDREALSNVLAKCRYHEPGFPDIFGAVRMVEIDGGFGPRFNVSDSRGMSYGIGIAGSAESNAEHLARFCEIVVSQILPWLDCEYAGMASSWDYISPAEKRDAVGK